MRENHEVRIEIEIEIEELEQKVNPNIVWST
jgi:hypothetical protein